ncbi:outer membrane lipid asymmetry maintenance protein MlaD [Azospirillum sp.]|uniref:outer membrane lipid asymmetry maintenance protein MlaD n=1 Tax=Azospirillum sp. TaxID=34012 RepID=UPI002D486C44|nr:outer membrane lipid asymmetry maintenance protein MlaD [Azospirillum sp.]HYD65955.1 outer membrane lipid asymmetry maintenance protein MlaD [Azospirillum sp.]
MRRNVIETVLGGVVLVVAGFFLVFAYTSADLRKVDGYEVTARFGSISGLQSGADVRISGVKVGTVTSLTLDPKSYQAVVHLSIAPDVKLPKDTAAVVASESLLGGKFMALEPGGDPDMIAPGGRIEYTQSTPGLEQLLGQVIFSLQSNAKGGDKAETGKDAPPKM